MIANAVPGFRVGHWTHPSGTTGCTVVLAERPALAFREVRGGAPGTRETDVLVPGNLVRRLDAVLLTGGSAFGLTAADGVVRWLRERQRGFPTAVVPVPIVAAAVVYDLTGTEPIFPDSDAGYAACDAASPDGWLSGRIGAGAGATAGKLRGRQWATPTGIGAATVALDDYRLGALAVVNPVGEVIDPSTGRILAGVRAESSDWLPARELILSGTAHEDMTQTNTTLVVVATDYPVDQNALIRMAIAAHDAIARTIRPAHTIFDGDTVFVLTIEEAPTDPARTLRVATATERVVERAICASTNPDGVIR